VATYSETLQQHFAKLRVKRHLAVIRTLFNWLVLGGVVATDPAHAGAG